MVKEHPSAETDGTIYFAKNWWASLGGGTPDRECINQALIHTLEPVNVLDRRIVRQNPVKNIQ